MSLAVAALRIATVKALEGATSAGLRVFDSTVDPRDLLGDEAAPTIVVYADRGHRRFTGRDLIGGDHSVELALELFVAKASIVTGADADDAGQTYEMEYPATDAAHENRLRRLVYEIETVLTGAMSPWAEVWRTFAVTASEHPSEWDRGADAKEGRRFNFLRLIYRLDTLADPVRGEPLGPAWQKIIGLMADDDEYRLLAHDWRSLITTPDMPAWRGALASIGLTYAELCAIGLSPLLDHQETDTTESAEMIEITLDPDALSIDTAAPKSFETAEV